MPELRLTGRFGCVPVALCLFFFWQLGQTWASSTTQKKTHLGTAIMVGDGLLQYHHTCVLFKIFFISDEFFAGLRKIDTPTGPTFVKHGTRYDRFPDRLIVDVEATVWECPLRPGMPPDYGSSLIEGASFEVTWQAIGESQSPAALISTRMHHNLGMKWNYFLELETKNIPLTDILNVDISLRGDTSHAHLQAGL